ncbi:hypothetical protein [Virgibacillus salexigens]|uniref:hypothetical protein n=1 Tax=Virgibacillus salexigens TaxID=61016 RepID=UPI00190D98B4|nr:hypothetical protein [Virgibacillus salexigens]
MEKLTELLSELKGVAREERIINIRYSKFDKQMEIHLDNEDFLDSFNNRSLKQREMDYENHEISYQRNGIKFFTIADEFTYKDHFEPLFELSDEVFVTTDMPGDAMKEAGHTIQDFM